MPAGEETDIRALCVKYMHILQEISRESVVFSIPMGPNLVTIDGIEPEGQAFSAGELGAGPAACEPRLARDPVVPA